MTGVWARRAGWVLLAAAAAAVAAGCGDSAPSRLDQGTLAPEGRFWSGMAHDVASDRYLV